MVARKTTKRAKVKPTFSRRARTGFAAAPQDNFRNFNDYVRTEVDKKDVISKIKSYIRKVVPKADARIAMDAPEWSFAGLPLLASTIVWKEMDKEFPAWWDADKVLKKHVKELLARGRAKQAEKANKPEETGPVKKTIQEIIQERTSEFIGGIDNVVDLIPVIKLRLLVIVCYQLPKIKIFFIFINRFFNIFYNIFSVTFK